MSIDRARMDAYDRRVLDGISQHGHIVQGIPDADPPFVYTVGLSANDLPEIYISGPIHPGVLANLANIAAELLKGGKLPLGHVAEVVQDFEVAVLAMTKEQCDAAEMNTASHLFGDITGLQIVLPDGDGTLPGDPDWLNEIGQLIHGSPQGQHCTKCLVAVRQDQAKALDGTYAPVWTSMHDWICPRDGEEHTPPATRTA